MKPRILSALSKVFFFLAAAQAALLAVFLVLSLAGPSPHLNPGDVVIKEPGHELAEAVWQAAPWLFVLLLAGLGYYTRWLSRSRQA
jgi:hypothetical protein